MGAFVIDFQYLLDVEERIGITDPRLRHTYSHVRVSSFNVYIVAKEGAYARLRLSMHSSCTVGLSHMAFYLPVCDITPGVPTTKAMCAFSWRTWACSSHNAHLTLAFLPLSKTDPRCCHVALKCLILQSLGCAVQHVWRYMAPESGPLLQRDA